MSDGRPHGVELTLFEALPHKVWLADTDGNVFYFNTAGLDYVGLGLEEFLERGWESSVHPEDLPLAQQAWSDALATGQPMQAEYRLRRHDGVHRWHEERGAFAPAGGGGPDRWIGTLTDVHDRREAERQFADAERRAAQRLAMLDAMQQHAPIGLGFLDRDLRVLHANAALAAVPGWTVGDVLGRRIVELVGTEQWLELAPTFRRVLDDGETVLDLEVTSRDPEGKRRDWLVSYYPVEHAGDRLGVGAIARDVTRARVQERRRHALETERLELLTRLATVADEERRRIAEHLHDDAVQTVAATLLRLDHAISTGSTAALQAARQPLEAAIRTLRLTIQRLAPPTASAASLEEAIETYAEYLLRHEGIEVELDVRIAPDLQLPTQVVQAVHRLVQEALANVLGHARASGVRIQLELVDEWLRGSVTDDGIGFDPTDEAIEHRGLRLMREQAEVLGGACRVVALPNGSGTSVTWALPSRPGDSVA
ncbi:PAS domain-containing protein [Egicoccus sp. AB-alg6-2]|uniref:PAS domain-containing sensor histidine kinase n=1 Tax=Egicoccus sp. AB-alg6-2 TaxID=3242692 RepID=UPI00359DF1B1